MWYRGDGWRCWSSGLCTRLCLATDVVWQAQYSPFGAASKKFPLLNVRALAEACGGWSHVTERGVPPK